MDAVWNDSNWRERSIALCRQVAKVSREAGIPKADTIEEAIAALGAAANGKAQRQKALGWIAVELTSDEVSEYPPLFRRAFDMKPDCPLAQALLRGRLRTPGLAFEYEMESARYPQSAFAPIVSITADLRSVHVEYCIDGCVNEVGERLFGPNGERLLGRRPGE